MNAPLDNIVQHLFHQPSLQSVTMDELERVARQNPSFAVAQFLLLKKMQETEHPGFTQQLHKTTLYFNNPLWLQFLLQPKNESKQTYNNVANFDQPVGMNSINAEKDREKDTNYSLEENRVPETAPITAEYENEIKSVELSSGIDLAVQSEPLSAMEIAEQFDFKNESVQKVDTQQYPSSGEMNLNAESLPLQINADNDQVTPGNAELTAQETITELVEEPKATVPSETVMQSAVETAELFLTEKQAALDADDTEIQQTQQATEAVSQMPLLKTIIESAAAKDDLLFEPYHTIDYFASQGIKLSKIEPEPKDKLGRQLKSFTEWLKMMKKLPQISVDKILAENEESRVVEAASQSIESKEVITEAMAEVYEKQGLHDKAVEVYHKLSLLNPGKSAYFAGRIEALKH